ncbi:MAG: hypothetical protein Q8S13_08845, partial [Dehalococcoidia bacterium]|nr:hypothetical protein [Dehalococcoidia bacterium]
RVLDELFKSPAAHRGTSAYNQLAVPNALDGDQFLTWATPELQKPGATVDPALTLVQGELQHIARWPNERKELVRGALVDAIDKGTPVEFFWRLHDTPEEATTVRPTPSGRSSITFFSPWDNVRAASADNIIVDVNP